MVDAALQGLRSRRQYSW